MIAFKIASILQGRFCSAFVLQDSIFPRLCERLYNAKYHTSVNCDEDFHAECNFVTMRTHLKSILDIIGGTLMNQDGRVLLAYDMIRLLADDDFDSFHYNLTSEHTNELIRIGCNEQAKEWQNFVISLSANN